MNLKELMSLLCELEPDRVVQEKEAPFGVRYRFLKPFSNQVVMSKVFASPTDKEHSDIAISSKLEEYLVLGTLMDWATEDGFTVEVVPYSDRWEVLLKRGIGRESWQGKGVSSAIALIAAWVKVKSIKPVDQLREIPIA